MKTKVILALGTNYNQINNMEKAKRLLNGFTSYIRYSTQTWTEPIGIVSDHFLNCLAIGETDMTLQPFISSIKRIEKKCGDSPSLREENIVCMDIDILMYGDIRMHQGDWQRPYIQQLMKELTSDK